MPTLVRLLTILCLLAAAVFGVMLALVTFVEPTRRETILDVPLPAPERPAGGEPAAGGDGS